MRIRSALEPFLIVILFLPSALHAQSTPTDPPPVSWNGYLQPQYEVHDGDDGTTDRAFFRRLVVGLQASLPRDWTTALQIDVAPVASGDSNRLIVKDAFLRFTGWEDHGVLLTIGNQKTPFSRSLLASSSRRALVERPFTGDRGLGSPGRTLGIRGEGWHQGRRLYWSSSLGSAHVSPDHDEIRVEGVADAGDGWNEGPIVSARIEAHPHGEVPRTQGDFTNGPFRWTVGAGFYRWWNDDDVVPAGGVAADATRVTGLEVSGGIRGRGLSIDGEYQHTSASSLNSSLDAGLYREGHASLDKASVEAGYLLVGRHLEALLGLDIANAPAYATPWRRLAPGLNWYVNAHSLKFSLMHRESFDDQGVRRARSRATYLQAQISF